METPSGRLAHLKEILMLASNYWRSHLKKPGLFSKIVPGLFFNLDLVMI